MTLLSRDQIQNLIGMIAATEDDSLTCDECFGRIGESVESNLEGKELPEEVKQKMESHMRQCSCCKDEYDSVTLAVSEIQKKLKEG